MDVNQLQKYIDFYKSVMPAYPDSGTGYESAMNRNNYAGAALNFARGLSDRDMQGQPGTMPDFWKFGPQTLPTEPTNPFTARVQATEGTPYAQRPMSGMVNNYMARLLK